MFVTAAEMADAVRKGNYPGGIEDLRSWAELSDEMALTALAKLYWTGCQVNKDPAKAVELLTLAAKKDFKEALHDLIDYCRDKKGQFFDPDVVFKCGGRLSELGDPYGYYVLYNAYYTGLGAPKDIPKALDFLKKASDAGYPLAQAYLGAKHWEGKELAHNPDMAMRLTTLSADLDIPVALSNLAEFYADRRSKFYNPEMAIKTAERLANADPGIGHFRLFQFYNSDVFPLKDWSLAEQNLILSAEAGNTDAIVSLAGYYLEGHKTIRIDYARAAELAEKIVTTSAYANLILGRLHKSGNGFPQNGEKALKYLGRAVAMGNYQANDDIALMYFRGQGVPQDIPKACEIESIFAPRDAHMKKNLRIFAITEVLAPYALALSDGDFSIITAMCMSKDGIPKNACLLTIKGSPNYDFWKMMSGMGWARPAVPPFLWAAFWAHPVSTIRQYLKMSSYCLTELGAASLPVAWRAMDTMRKDAKKKIVTSA